MFFRKARLIREQHAYIARLEFAYSMTLEEKFDYQQKVSDLRRRLNYYQYQHPVVEAEFIFIEAVNPVNQGAH